MRHGLVDFAAMDANAVQRTTDALNQTTLAIKSLEQNPGWSMFIQAMKTDLVAVRKILDETIDPVALARAVGAQKQILGALNWREEQLAYVERTLKEIEMQRGK
jgi:hypothetical protein